MTTADFIIALFYRVDNQMSNVAKHPQAALYPSETVTLGAVRPKPGVTAWSLRRSFPC